MDAAWLEAEAALSNPRTFSDVPPSPSRGVNLELVATAVRFPPAVYTVTSLTCIRFEPDMYKVMSLGRLYKVMSLVRRCLVEG